MDLPPGFRFFPTEEELVSFYLHNKLEGSREDLNRVMDRIIPVLDIYDFNPWELPQYSGEACNRDPEQWFFFIPRQESEARGGRPKRLTTTGYWKATGSPGLVYSNTSHRSIGMKRTMVFYRGRAPNGRKTEWKMNEYKAIQGDHHASSSSASSSSSPKLRQEFSLCRVYKKSKCLRAFDRRPLGVEIGYEMRLAQAASAAVAAAAHGDEATTSSHHQNPPSTVERTSSSDQSSSSGDHGTNPSQTGETTDMPMSFDPEPWDWELEWYYSGDHQDVQPK